MFFIDLYIFFDILYDEEKEVLKNVIKIFRIFNRIYKKGRKKRKEVFLILILILIISDINV